MATFKVTSPTGTTNWVAHTWNWNSDIRFQRTPCPLVNGFVIGGVIAVEFMNDAIYRPSQTTGIPTPPISLPYITVWEDQVTIDNIECYNSVGTWGTSDLEWYIWHVWTGGGSVQYPAMLDVNENWAETSDFHVRSCGTITARSNVIGESYLVSGSYIDVYLWNDSSNIARDTEGMDRFQIGDIFRDWTQDKGTKGTFVADKVSNTQFDSVSVQLLQTGEIDNCYLYGGGAMIVDPSIAGGQDSLNYIKDSCVAITSGAAYGLVQIRGSKFSLGFGSGFNDYIIRKVVAVNLRVDDLLIEGARPGEGGSPEDSTYYPPCGFSAINLHMNPGTSIRVQRHLVGLDVSIINDQTYYLNVGNGELEVHIHNPPANAWGMVYPVILKNCTFKDGINVGLRFLIDEFAINEECQTLSPYIMEGVHFDPDDPTQSWHTEADAPNDTQYVCTIGAQNKKFKDLEKFNIPTNELKKTCAPAAPVDIKSSSTSFLRDDIDRTNDYAKLFRTNTSGNVPTKNNAVLLGYADINSYPAPNVKPCEPNFD